MDSSDDFEDDPFNYQPLKRRKLAGPSQNKTQNQAKKKLTNKGKSKPTKPSESRQPPKQSQPTPKSKPTQIPKRKNRAPSPILSQRLPNVTKTLNDLLNNSEELCFKKPQPEVTNTECPICQLPLQLLTGVVSSTNHLADCAEISISFLPPCPNGVDCTSRVVSHYSKYDHTELARHRDLGFMNQTTKDISPSQLSEQPSPKMSSTISTIPLPKFSSTRNNVSQAPAAAPPPQLSSTRMHTSQPVAPPKRFATPRAEYISPIKVIRRSSQKITKTTYKCDLCERTFSSENVFEEHVCAQKENVARTPSPVRKVNQETPHVRTDHQRRFLREIASDKASELSTSLLAKNKRTKDWVNFSKSDIFDEDLQNQIENAIQRVNSENRITSNIIEGNSEEAGPSGINNNHRVKQINRKSNLVKVVIDEKEVDISLEPSLIDPNEKVAPVAAPAKSPIKVTAEKDSQELELSLNIDPGVHCTKLRLRVPLKKTESGNDLPVEVSANYTEMKSPAKQAQITEYFKNKGGGPSRTSSTTPPTSNDLGVVNLTKAKADWNKIFGRAKARGYLAPTPQSSQEKVPRKEQTKRKLPWYKNIKDTVLSVDAFNYGDLPGVKYYLLSHFHYDHYIGLTKGWKHPIVSSSITKRLATTCIGVKDTLFTTLDPGESRVVGGCELTAVDANHCPGSVMFVIRLTSGETLLHVGDCRACHSMEEEPVFWNTRIDKLYLDTTYCRPEYDFPSQSDVITRTVEMVLEFVASKPDTVVMVGAYTVGKERIFKAIAAGLESKVWGDNKRVRTWRCLEDSEILGRLVGDRKRAQVQVVMNQLVGWPKLGMELDKIGGRWSHVLGVKPTGWTHSRGEGREQSLAGIRIVTRGQVSLLEVPYSEHSSYSELKRFVQFLRIGSEKDIIPTVNVRDTDNMRRMFKEWIDERKALGPESQ